MNLKLIYPRWPKLKNQPEFHLPPHGPVCFAATVPADVNLTFCDEHVQKLDLDDSPDFVGISVMLTCQLPRAKQIADHYRSRGIPVIFGGISTMLHHEEILPHADSVFLGETEGRFGAVIDDFKSGRLKKIYNYLNDFPDTNLIGPARRGILQRELYNFRGVQMVDLIHASRGCRFNCFPCCTPFLGGRKFRPRPVERVVEELSQIENNRFFFVDNSMAQNDEWEKELFKAIAPLKKKWISHPIKDNDKILDLAAAAGCWYVYQAVIDTSEVIRKRVKRLKERGIGVEGTIILGMDDHDEDYIKRLVDFLLDIELDLAEFTVLTPFPQTSIRADLEKQGRVLQNRWEDYTGGTVVYKPKLMAPEKLQEMYEYAWNTFYHDYSKEVKMGKLYMKVIQKEQDDGTHRPMRLSRARGWNLPAKGANP